MEHEYKVKYLIVGAFGDLLWTGTTTIVQNVRRPDSETEQAVLDVQMARTIRESCDQIGAPPGRVLIAAVHPVEGSR